MTYVLERFSRCALLVKRKKDGKRMVAKEINVACLPEKDQLSAIQEVLRYTSYIFLCMPSRTLNRRSSSTRVFMYVCSCVRVCFCGDYGALFLSMPVVEIFVGKGLKLLWSRRM